jgi:hypothetical protein
MNKSVTKEEAHKKAKAAKPKKEGTLKNAVKKPVKEIKPEHYFYLCDGRVLKDMIELSECLETINNDVFYYHVNDQRNDFANWVRDIFERRDLADEIMTIREPRQVQVVILKHLAKKRQ